MLRTDPTMLEPPVVAVATGTFFGNHLNTLTKFWRQQPRWRSQGQLAAEIKSMTPNTPHRVRDRETCQRSTAKEGTILKVDQRVGDGDACQRSAAIKGTPFNVRHIYNFCVLPTC